MYQANFKLSEEAFSLSPDPRFIYFTSQHKEALYKTEYAITQKKGISAIYGDIGAGKTSLARRLWEKYASHPEYNFRILPHSNYPSAYQLVKDILKEFKIDKPTRSISDALDALQAYLTHEYAQGKITVVVIDEAQDLRPKNFETIRQLLNFENNREKLLQIVLFGQNELSTKLDRQPALKDRIVTWSALTNLTFEDSVEMINFRWRVAGGADTAPFDQEALEAMYFYSNGLPRKISNICTNALIRTVASGLSVVNKDIVEYVANEIRLNPELMKVKRIGRPKKNRDSPKTSMNDQNKKPVIGGFSDMMEMSEKKFAQKEKTEADTKKNESSLERKNVLKEETTEERTLKHHSFDIFVDQLISLDQMRTQMYQEKGKKPKISTLVQEALDAHIKNHKKEITNE